MRPAASKAGGARLRISGAGRPGPGEEQGGRGERVLGHGEQGAVALGVLGVDGPGMDGADGGQAGEGGAGPGAGGDGAEDGLQLVQQADDQGVAGPVEALQRDPLGRFEQRDDVAGAGEEGGQADGEHGVWRVGCGADGPGGAGADHEPVAVPDEACVCGQVDSGLRAGAIADPEAGIEEAGFVGEDQAVGGAVESPQALMLTGSVSNRMGASAGSVPRRHRRTVQA